ncbi:MAG TPA: transcription elongation factor GreB [Bacteriovoracaceae bacterium]|nr:transcription elongation factor GreB [Bacteriovoracaceae bacterium]
MKKNNYITPTGFKRLQDELEQLLRVERPEVTRLVQWAASNGDRSENADYLYGKKKLREIDRRVRFLSGRLDDSVVVAPETIVSEKVQFGALVTVCDEHGLVKKFTIVGVDEVDTARGHISWQSPIGMSLLGKTVGDSVLVKLPSGEMCYEINSIEYRPSTENS